jgi:hypothetical protein
MVALLRGLGWLAIVASGSLLAICLRSIMTDEEAPGSPGALIFIAAILSFWGYLMLRDGSKDAARTTGGEGISWWEWDQEEW